MGFIEKYVHDRRKKKLSKINEALAKLQKEHPFDPSAFKPKTQASVRNPAMSKQKSVMSLIIIILLAVGLLILGWTTFHYKGAVADLQEDYDAKADKLQLLEGDIKNKTSLLEETKDTLKYKEERAQNLTGESQQLKENIALLDTQIAALKKEAIAKEAELLNLNKTVTNQKREITLWKVCIKDEFKEDPDKCDI